MDTGVRFGRRLQTLRNAAALSQEELARAAGLSRNYVGALERGEQVPTLSTIESLARGLGVDPPKLLEFADGERAPTRADALARKIALLARGATRHDVERFEKLARAYFGR